MIVFCHDVTRNLLRQEEEEDQRYECGRERLLDYC